MLNIKNNLLLTILLIIISLSAYIINAQYLGLLTSIISIICIINTKSLLSLLLACLNFSTGIAFDYFLRVRRHAFEFYFNNGTTVELLCLVSLLTFITITAMASAKIKGRVKGVTIRTKPPEFSNSIFYPCIIAIVSCIIFITSKEQSILSKSFDVYELQKYSFLEYFGLIVIFAIGSAKANKTKSLIAYGSAALLFLVCLAMSYRMVAIVIALAMIYMKYNNNFIRKKYVVALWIGGYISLAAISYIRLGIFDISIGNIFGYINGRLDNTFTGVIETALIYSGVAKSQGLYENLLHLLGTIAPLPNSLLPDDMLYIVNVHAKHSGKIPGGGLLAGFIIYFNYLLIIPVFTFLYLTFKKAHISAIYGGLYIVTFICISRWWLYGPFALFKFSGIFLLIYLINHIFLTFEKKAKNKNSLTKQNIYWNHANS